MQTEETPIEELQFPIFVYGNERPGAIGYRLIRDLFVEGGIRPATLQGFRMYNFRDFPGIVKATPDVPPVVGELLIPDEENYWSVVGRLDGYLGHGFAFIRTSTLFADIWPKEENGLEWQDRRKTSVRAWVYVVNHRVIQIDPTRSIKSNDWMNRD